MQNLKKKVENLKLQVVKVYECVCMLINGFQFVLMKFLVEKVGGKITIVTLTN